MVSGYLGSDLVQLAPGPASIIDEVPPPWRRGKGAYRPPVVIPSKGNHPLLRFLTTLSEVRIGEAFEFAD